VTNPIEINGQDLDIQAYEEIVHAGHEILAAVSKGVMDENWPPSLKVATLLALQHAIDRVKKKMEVEFSYWDDIGLCIAFGKECDTGCPMRGYDEEEGEAGCLYWMGSEEQRTVLPALEQALTRLIPENRNMVLTGKAIRTVYAHVID
jgi:hypothetical protein